MLTRTELGGRLCRALEPEAWEEYDAGNGVCSNQAGWKCLASVEAAARAMDLLHELGFPVPPKK